MAETAALRRARLDAERQALRARVSELRRRLDEDRAALGEERERLVGPESWVANHPATVVASSAALGFAAGLAPAPKPTAAPVSAARKVTSKGASLGLNALKIEAGVIVRDVVDGMFGRSGHERQPESG